jgi:hypothetical protein
MTPKVNVTSSAHHCPTARPSTKHPSKLTSLQLAWTPGPKEAPTQAMMFRPRAISSTRTTSWIRRGPVGGSNCVIGFPDRNEDARALPNRLITQHLYALNQPISGFTDTFGLNWKTSSGTATNRDVIKCWRSGRSSNEYLIVEFVKYRINIFMPTFHMYVVDGLVTGSSSQRPSGPWPPFGLERFACYAVGTLVD